jgi:membrane-associated phospholipid phosphatase
LLADLDRRVLYAMRTRGHGRVPETIARVLGKIGEHGAIWLALGILFALIDPANRWEWLFAGVLGPVGIVLNFLVKLVVKRPRPQIPGYPPIGGAPSSLSFPSAHATSSFAAATAMTRVDDTAALLFILAFAIAFCRPYLGMHYPSDVIAGAILGTILGLVWPLGLVS